MLVKLIDQIRSIDFYYHEKETVPAMTVRAVDLARGLPVWGKPLDFATAAPFAVYVCFRTERLNVPA